MPQWDILAQTLPAPLHQLWRSGKVPSNCALRMADLQTASNLTTGYEGPMPNTKVVDHQGAIVLGVGGDNSNNSWGTFFEGAIVAGCPADDTELAVFQNVKAAGY